MVFDQSAWQQATTWDGPRPSLGDLWRLLTDDSLPAPVKASAHAESTKNNVLRDARKSIGAASEGDPSEARSWAVRFANLLSGRFTELLFERRFRGRIEALGLQLTEEVALRNWIDFRIAGDGFALGINTKNAGVQFAGAERWVGLQPADTLPIATYKIFGSDAAVGIPPLVYVYLVDWQLLQTLRHSYFFDILTDVERQVFRAIATTKRMSRNFEDVFVDCTVRDRFDALATAVGYEPDGPVDPPFRAVSGAMCRRIFYTLHGRSPYVFRQRMQTDPNTHLSVADDTVAFADFVDAFLLTPEARAALLAGLAATSQIDVPDPPA